MGRSTMYALVREDVGEGRDGGGGHKQVMFEEMTMDERCRTGCKVLLMALLGAGIGGGFVLLKWALGMDI